MYFNFDKLDYQHALDSVNKYRFELRQSISFKDIDIIVSALEHMIKETPQNDS